MPAVSQEVASLIFINGSRLFEECFCLAIFKPNKKYSSSLNVVSTLVT